MYKFRGVLIEKWNHSCLNVTFIKDWWLFPGLQNRVDDLLAGIDDRQNTKLSEFEITVRRKFHIQVCLSPCYMIAWNKLHLFSLCWDVLQCWKWSACRVRWSSCRNSWRASRCYKPLKQPVNISLKYLTTSQCLLYCSYCILVLHSNFFKFLSELRNDLTSKRAELQKCVNDLKEKNQRDARMSKWKET